MSSLLATRAARRRWILFTVLLVISVLLMAFSSNPVMRDLQSGVQYAFSPFQSALDGTARNISSVFGAITEIDRLRVDNAALRAENERLTTENARLDEIRRENEALTALLQMRAGFDYATAAVTVIARESSEFRRVVIVDKGTEAGIKVGDVAVAAGGALAGRVTEAGPNSATIVLLTDGELTVIGQLATNAATGEVVGQLGGVLIMRQIDFGRGRRGRRRGRDRRDRARWRRALAVSQGSPDRPGRGRPARCQRCRPDGVPPAGCAVRQARVPAGHHGLRGRPATDRGAADRLQREPDPARGRAAVPVTQPRPDPGPDAQAMTRSRSGFVPGGPRCYASRP